MDVSQVQLSKKNRIHEQKNEGKMLYVFYNGKLFRSEDFVLFDFSVTWQAVFINKGEREWERLRVRASLVKEQLFFIAAITIAIKQTNI